MNRRTFSTILAAFILCFVIAGCSNDIVVSKSADQYIGQQYENVVLELSSAGFINITTEEIDDLGIDEASKEGTVYSISINGDNTFSAKTKFPPETVINIKYYTMKKLPAPLSSNDYEQMDGQSAEQMFREAGFTEITFETVEDLTSETKDQEGNLQSIEIGGLSEYRKGDLFSCDSIVVIRLHTLKMVALPLSSAEIKGALFSDIRSLF